MFPTVRLFRPIGSATILLLALTSCNNTQKSISSLFDGNSAQEYAELQYQLHQDQAKLAQLDRDLEQAKLTEARTTYDLMKKLTHGGQARTPFSVKDIDNLSSKRRDFEHLAFDIEDMRKTLASFRQNLHALQYQYNAYAGKLEDFKQTHPTD